MRSSSSAKAARLLGAAALLGALGGSTAALAQSRTSAPTGLACPAHLDTTQGADAPAGWSAERLAAPKPLAEIAFFDGPVKDRVQLAPSSDAKRGADTVSSWRFDRSPGIRHLACIYRGTDVMLVRPLPAAIRQCSVTLAGPGQALRPGALACR